MRRIIAAENSLVLAMDVDGAWFYDLITALDLVEQVGALKFGFLQLNTGLESCVELARETLGEIPILYDHQKIGSGVTAGDIKFAKTLKRAGVNAVIIYPFTGPNAQEYLIRSFRDAGLDVLIGGLMTHERFLVSEGGYVADEAVLTIFSTAIDLGVEHFVIPGNKMPWVARIKELLDSRLGPGGYELYGNGFIRQGGDLASCMALVGGQLHAIIGAAIYMHKNVEDMRKAAVSFSNLLLQQSGVLLNSGRYSRP